MPTTKEHEHDVAAIGHALRHEAHERGWCSEYDAFIDSLNIRLNIKLPDRVPPSSSFKTWRERMGTTVWEKGWIDQWFHHIAPKAMGLYAHGRQTNLTVLECERLDMMLDERTKTGNPVVVTDKQAEQGRTWLARYWKRLGIPELAYENITHFTFVGADCVEIGHGQPSSAPIYVAHWRDGSTFRYSNNSWQSGIKSLDFTTTPARSNIG